MTHTNTHLRTTETLSERRFYATLTGRGNGHPIGPSIITVRITQTRRAGDGRLCRPSYFVEVDGTHQWGGVAEHLPESGVPDGVGMWAGELVEVEAPHGCTCGWAPVEACDLHHAAAELVEVEEPATVNTLTPAMWEMRFPLLVGLRLVAAGGLPGDRSVIAGVYLARGTVDRVDLRNLDAAGAVISVERLVPAERVWADYTPEAAAARLAELVTA